MTHNYALLEATALAQRRLGLAAVRLLHHDVMPALRVVWIDEATHAAAVAALLAAERRALSLADWVSFEVMRRRRIETAFAFDRDFEAHGFAVVP